MLESMWISLFNNFCWSTVARPCCVSSCCGAQCISHTCTRALPSQGRRSWAELPMLWVGSHQLPVLYRVVCTCQCQSPDPSTPLPRLGILTFVLYICVSISGKHLNFLFLKHWKLKCRSSVICLRSHLQCAVTEGPNSITAASFITVQRWKQPKDPWTDGWLNNRWYIHTKGYHSALKREEPCRVLPHKWTWRHDAESKKSDTKEQILYNSAYVRDLG